MNLVERVSAIQAELKAPKNQFNKFGGYKYRSCEDILEAVKPLLNGLMLTVSDEIIMLGDRYYVKATATITDGSNSVSNSALARESLTKKGMDESQITGTASSYARKYALNGLFLIDDTRDADATNDHGKAEEAKKKPEQVERPSSAKTKEIANCPSLEGLTALWNSIPVEQHGIYKQFFANRKTELLAQEQAA